jgi:hypothetical protein
MRCDLHSSEVPPLKLGAQQTAEYLKVNTSCVSPLQPEFCGFQEARQLFGLSRSHLYRLADEGRIKSVVLRGKGKLRGRRLFVVESIRSLLLSNLYESK